MPPGLGEFPEPVWLEWYRGRTLVRRIELTAPDESAETAGEGAGFPFAAEHRLDVGEAGYYWFGVRRGFRFAVSGPQWAGKDAPVETPFRERHGIRGFEAEQFLLNPNPGEAPPCLPAWIGGAAVILHGSEEMEVKDRMGRPVPFRMEKIKEDVIIHRSADRESFREFFLWLERNEIHEYKFISIDYSIEKGTLRFSGTLLPVLNVPETALDTMAPRIGEEIRQRWAEIERTVVDVRVVPEYRCRFSPEDTPLFPLTIEDSKLAFSSSLVLPRPGLPIQLFNEKRIV